MKQSWRKHLKQVKINNREKSPQSTTSGVHHASSHQNESWLPEYYYGSPDRFNRYRQYDYMDFDVDVNMALDKTAEFSTLLDETTDLPFILKVDSNVSTTDNTVLQEYLRKWVRKNDLSAKVFDMFRSTIKYGDQIYIRDPDTLKLYWVDVTNVVRTIVNIETKEIEYYCIRNLDLNLQAAIASRTNDQFFNVMGAPPTNVAGGTASKYSFDAAQYNVAYDISNNSDQSNIEFPVGAEHVLHLSMNNGTDALWPFGRSVLDTVFKPFRQKELMEDAIIIYRVQRSPERYVFKIDTGDMNEKKSAAYIDQVKTEFRQKRKPVVSSQEGGSIMDTTYNPISMTDDFFFAQGMDGRGSSVEVLPGGECLALDTEIRLLDGSIATLQECIDRYENGEQLWTFSINPHTGVVIPALVSWAGITKEDAEMLQLEFSDGSTVNVTTNHKFPVKGRGEVEAQHINIGDEFYHVDIKSEKDHNQYYNDQNDSWMKVSDMFNGFFEEYPMNLQYRELLQDTRILPKKQRDSVTLKAVRQIPNDITGTLAIDSKEFFTDNHNFTLANGVFTQNSTGSIEDLKFFSNRLVRSLRVPISYMSFLTEDGQTLTYNDGKNGTAYMEEFSFSEYCKRLQRQIIAPLDTEFKLFLKRNGVQISSSDFELTFTPPQSFSEYRQIELDTAQLGVFQSIADVSYLSNRFKLKRFLNMTDTEIKENERLWAEENKANIDLKRRSEDEDVSLKDGNVTEPSDMDIEDSETDEFDMMNDDGGENESE